MGQVVSQFIADYGELLVEGVRDTIIMTAVATLLAYVIGLPVGVLLITSTKRASVRTHRSTPCSAGS